MLEFRNVVFQYDSEDFNIIDGLSFHLEKGEFVSVIGAVRLRQIHDFSPDQPASAAQER